MAQKVSDIGEVAKSMPKIVSVLLCSVGFMATAVLAVGIWSNRRLVRNRQTLFVIIVFFLITVAFSMDWFPK